jgi:anti-sigma regulatory factor (Ser/Thr protein kinase)
MVRQESTYILKDVYPSDPRKRNDIIDALCNAITSSNINVDITPQEIYLSLDEAITNAMEHGNHWDPRKTIAVEITVDRSHVHIAITDEGNGFSTKKVKSLLKKRDLLSNRGRGIFIINQFCELTWNEKGNRIDLQIKRKK